MKNTGKMKKLTALITAILMILAAFAGNIGMIAFFVLTFAAALVPIVYSFWLHQRQGL